MIIQKIYSNTYIVNVINYIAGFITYTYTKTVKYEICKNQLIGNEMPFLSAIKNRGSYLIPSNDACSICQISKKKNNKTKYFYQLLQINIKNILMNEIFSQINNSFCNKTMDEHIFTQDALNKPFL